MKFGVSRNLNWKRLRSSGWRTAAGRCGTATPGAAGADGPDHDRVVLDQRARTAFKRLNPEFPPGVLEDAFPQAHTAGGASLESRNRAAHRMPVDGATVEYRADDGGIRGAQARVLDFERPDANDGWPSISSW